jgi:DNA-binding transcriptional regulator LsrR (DeoR family)
MAGQDESDNLLRLAATLYYRDGLDQGDVADLMGISRSTVSRLLARAREKGIVRISVEHYDPRHHALEEQLQRRFRLNHAIVIRTEMPCPATMPGAPWGI